MMEQEFGRYLVLGELGAGGMGRVLRAEDPLLARTVALKILPPELTGDAARRERLLREARASSALNHPNIVVVYDVGESNGQLYVAMELVDGVTLRQWSASPRSVAEIVDTCRQIALGLSHAHRANLVHRDIKPENVMVRADGLVKILDFGLAKSEAALPSVADDATQPPRSSAALIGTPEYLSPEQAQGRGSTARSDFFAFGAVLYELLAGRRAFGGGSLLEVLERIVRTEPEPLAELRPDLPADLSPLVTQLLEKDPAHRPATAGEVADRLDAIGRAIGLSSTPVAELPTRPIVSKPRKQPKRRLRPIVGLAAVVALLASLSVLVVRHQQRRSIPQSIAVLPLQNASAVPEDTEFLANGLSETLATQLTRLPGLRVTPWITSQRYGGDERPFAQIAAELGVETLLIGTLKEVDGRLLATVSLVDAKTGFQRWSQEFESMRNDLLGVQREIARDVATRLHGRLAGEELRTIDKLPSQNSEAYELYLRGAHALQRGDETSLEIAAALFQRALQVDPNLAEAHIGVGAMSTASFFSGSSVGMLSLADAEASFRRALELDPTSIAARRGLIRVYFNRGENERSLQVGQEIAGLDRQDAEALMGRADAYSFGTLWEKAIPLYEEVLRLDPANAGALAFLAITQSQLGRYQESLANGQRFIDMYGIDADPELNQLLAVALYCTGDIASLRVRVEMPDELPEESEWRSRLLERDGEYEKSKEPLREAAGWCEQELRSSPDNLITRSRLVVLYGKLGERQNVLMHEEWFLKHSPTYGPGLAGLGWAHALLGDVQVAKQYYRDALALRYRYDIASSCLYGITSFAPKLRSQFDDVMREYEALGEQWAAKY